MALTVALQFGFFFVDAEQLDNLRFVDNVIQLNNGIPTHIPD